MDDRIILITGATSGIGKETARSLSRMGARVIITARDMNRGEAVKNEIVAASNDKVKVLQCDLASQVSIEACTEEINKTYG